MPDTFWGFYVQGGPFMHAIAVAFVANVILASLKIAKRSGRNERWLWVGLTLVPFPLVLGAIGTCWGLFSSAVPVLHQPGSAIPGMDAVNHFPLLFGSVLTLVELVAIIVLVLVRPKLKGGGQRAAQ